MAKKISIREHLIDAILELSGDEFETEQDLVKLAKESEEELVYRIVDIAEYYKEQTI